MLFCALSPIPFQADDGAFYQFRVICPRRLLTFVLDQPVGGGPVAADHADELVVALGGV
jgi:hypothetical protein